MAIRLGQPVRGRDFTTGEVVVFYLPNSWLKMSTSKFHFCSGLLNFFQASCKSCQLIFLLTQIQSMVGCAVDGWWLCESHYLQTDHKRSFTKTTIFCWSCFGPYIYSKCEGRHLTPPHSRKKLNRLECVNFWTFPLRISGKILHPA